MVVRLKQPLCLSPNHREAGYNITSKQQWIYVLVTTIKTAGHRYTPFNNYPLLHTCSSPRRGTFSGERIPSLSP